MSELPYDVDADLGDDPQETEIAECERTIDPDFNILGYDFVDDDSRGEWGITQEVRAERRPVVPHQRWGTQRSAEEDAVSVVPESDIAAEPDAAPDSDV
ncbi:hypothetical protein BJF83_09515 [Nocardiopsis sp. CNR-923]|uniref:hypothetical protein n=1 Tax=Nocardiopsis sp. CNR-923 TaxID=1904965 RepID=UPI000969230B|nr:hypothetical protein [Nocardiopsis sp. CNR-923]OLT29936.1 hypothetical protein BJF83_09515 [Nocardiopsis sp. CNR-923]